MVQSWYLLTNAFRVQNVSVHSLEHIHTNEPMLAKHRITKSGVNSVRYRLHNSFNLRAYGGGETQRPAYGQWAERLFRGRGGQSTQITSLGSGKESKLEETRVKS
jgi:hypothetical protein